MKRIKFPEAETYSTYAGGALCCLVVFGNLGFAHDGEKVYIKILPGRDMGGVRKAR